MHAYFMYARVYAMYYRRIDTETLKLSHYVTIVSGNYQSNFLISPIVTKINPSTGSGRVISTN